MLSLMNARLDRAGLLMHGDSIVDASIIQAPSSTKNSGGGRARRRGSRCRLRQAVPDQQPVLPALAGCLRRNSDGDTHHEPYRAVLARCYAGPSEGHCSPEGLD